MRAGRETLVGALGVVTAVAAGALLGRLLAKPEPATGVVLLAMIAIAALLATTYRRRQHYHFRGYAPPPITAGLHLHRPTVRFPRRNRKPEQAAVYMPPPEPALDPARVVEHPPSSGRRRRSFRFSRRGDQTPDPRVRRSPVSAHPIDVNAAGVGELQQLRGVGRAAAERIVAERARNGPFASIWDLARVEGFDEPRIRRFADRADA